MDLTTYKRKKFHECVYGTLRKIVCLQQQVWFKRFIKSWWRYIDDIFMLWKGQKKKLEDFLNHLNEVHPSLKFEWKISKYKISFLDCEVIRKNNRLKTDVHQKPTDCHPYLDHTSAYPSHFKRSIPYSQAKDKDTLKKESQSIPITL